MAHKTIMIQEDVYQLLNSLKGPNKSFNDVIKDLILKNNDIKTLFGVLDDKIANSIIDGIKKSKMDDKESTKENLTVNEWK